MTNEEIEKQNKIAEFDQRASENMRRWAQEDERKKTKPFDPETATEFECEMYDRARGIV